jgi:acyl-CoA reductase-like NAD-dependent aldehyde dehydrogenase
MKMAGVVDVVLAFALTAGNVVIVKPQELPPIVVD